MNVKDIKGEVMASSAYLDGKQIGVNLTMTLPGITPSTVEIVAAGGTIELPVYSKLEAMEASITLQGIHGDVIKKLTPERHNLTVNIVQHSVGADKSKHEHIKAHLEVVPKEMPGIESTFGEQTETELPLSVLSYKLIVDGKVVLHVDPIKAIYKVNGKNYAKDYTSKI